jgi:cyclomaltodextrinase
MTAIQTPDWVRDAIFYQIFPDRFARSARLPPSVRPGLGTPSNLEPWDSPPTRHGFKGGSLTGVTDKLDTLQDLGINAIYFNPVFASTANHRYHTHDYYQVDPMLGGNDALRELLDAAHARGMRVVLDGVFNHASRGFFAFNHTLENGAASPYVDWFHFNGEWLGRGRPPDAYPHRPRHGQEDSLNWLGYKGWADLPALPKLNTDTPAVRAYLFDVAETWVQFGIDGWRLDVPGDIDDVAFWQEFRQRVKAINPDAYIVGEIWHQAQRWLQGDQFDAVMNYPVGIALLGWLVGASANREEMRAVTGLAGYQSLDAARFADRIDTILDWYDPAISAVQMNVLDSHDTPRFLTMARGDRTAYKLATLFLMTFVGAPTIYYGDEVGMTGGHDPGCRGAFPWDEEVWDQDLRAWVKRCIALRHDHPALRRGTYLRLHAGDDVVVFARSLGAESLITAINAASAPRHLDLPLAGLLPDGAGVADVWTCESWTVAGGALQAFKLPARSGRVLKATGPEH